MRLLYFLLLTIVFTACQTDKTKISIYHFDNSVLVDTGLNSTSFLNYDQESEYPIYYLGLLKDTITIHNQYQLGLTKWTNYKYFLASRTYSDKTLALYVDTSIKTNSSIEYYSENSKVVEDSTENYHAYLLTVKNISDSFLYLGRTFSLYFLDREAKDKNGKWVRIDRKLSEVGLCLTGQPTLFLKKNDLVISKVKRYRGNFVTDFRLAFGYDDNVVYSNIWRDSIDERTLELAKANNSR